SQSRDASPRAGTPLREPNRDAPRPPVAQARSGSRDVSPRSGTPLRDAPRESSPSFRSPKLGDSAPQTATGSASRRLPQSGIRDRPRGGPFGDVTPAIRTRPRRLIGIMIVLLLIGIGVALGVAFSGPELEVTDPTIAPTVTPTVTPPANLGAPTAATPSATAKPPEPAELPGPPPATSGPP
ncbi:MAG TPA: hypothetical protein VHB97_16220, partial [Polyangia bacterium]|nr:hypothetical protein [Polyangia bacterium]